MAQRQTVIFLDYFKDLKQAASLISHACERLEDKPVIVSSNFDTSSLSEKTGLEVVYFDALLSKEDYRHMYDYVFDLTRKWHSWLPAQERVTEYKGISFGSIAEEMAHCSFSFLIKNLEITLKAINSMDPGSIIFIGEKDSYKGLRDVIAKNFNIEVRLIEKKADKVTGFKGARSWLMDAALHVFDGLMRWLAFFTANKDAVFIDGRIYLKSKELVKGLSACPYLLEKGFRIRLNLFKHDYMRFVPLRIKDRPLCGISPFGRFGRYWKHLGKQEEFKEKFNYRGLSVWPLFEERLKEFFISDFKRINRNVAFLLRAYHRIRPRVVVVREAVKELYRTIVFTAKRHKIPTLVIQHGALVEENIYTELYTDKIALWGSAGIEWYSRFGNNRDKYVVTGRPESDRLGYNIPPEVPIDPAKEVVLYMPNLLENVRYLSNVYHTWDSELPLLNSIFEASNHFPDKQWIIKAHPYDPVDIDALKRAREEKTHNKNVFIVKNVPIEPLIEIASLVIVSYFSSAVLDALMLDKPIISVKVYRNDRVSQLVSRSVAVGVDDPEGLIQAVDAVFSEEARRRLSSNRKSFISDYVYKTDGNSTTRIRGLIGEMRENGKGIFRRS